MTHPASIPVHHQVRDAHHRVARTRRPLAAATALAAAFALGACGSGTTSTPAGSSPAAAGTSAAMTTGTPTATATGSGTSTDTPVAAQTGLTIDSGWVKAGNGMTALFGTVRNSGSADVTIVSGTSAAASQVQIHTMEKQPDGTMKMVQKPGGLTVPAGGSAVLAPGADHIMLIGLTAPLANGDEVTVRMETADGTRLEWTVPVRSFSGADETYVPEMGTMAPTH